VTDTLREALSPTPQWPLGYTQIMTDTHHPADAEDRSEDQQQAVEACQHAADAFHGGDLSRAHSLLDEARAAVERAQHDDTPTQEQRETAYDCSV
jgi:hypothetical protein